LRGSLCGNGNFKNTEPSKNKKQARLREVKKMKVILKTGDVIGAEVIRIISGGLVLELDNCQETVISPSGLMGRDSKAKLDRFCSLSIGSELTVEVVNAFVGQGFKGKVEVKEVASKAAAPARTGRVLTATR
jgi:ribosomal protein S1